MATIKPYTITVPEAQIKDLRERLKNTIWPSIIPGNDYGGPSLKMMQQLVKKAQDFDWRKKEAELNKLPQFMTEIDGQTIHFIHAKSAKHNAMPLMLIHGWPGSIVEFLDMVEPLTNPKGDYPAFDVVVPSLPGFGFSGPTKDAGWGHDRMGKALIALMAELGYEKFAIQGGDAGAIIGPEMARMAPDTIIALHLNAATMGFIPMGPVDEKDIATFTPAEKRRLEMLQEFMQVKFGFNLLHSNQPQLVAYAISDSPAGLMSWITQLMDISEVGEERFITNFMIYWFTGTASSSVRMYYEAAHDPAAWAPKKNSGVPTSVAVFQDGDVAIRRYGEQANTIVRWKEYPHGGHYAVMSAPDDWLSDVREFFADLNK
ncbi:MAG TPA: epoxide hydrolase [Candidatus Saccharimonadales bacterium]|nr:epoxide hydrolase [Candidatus Saccharimonadales bacterium]